MGSYLTEGAEVLEVADLESLRARIYVSEYDMYKIREGAPARLYVDGTLRKRKSSAASVKPVALSATRRSWIRQNSRACGRHNSMLWRFRYPTLAAP